MLYFCYKNISDVSDEEVQIMKDQIAYHFSKTASLKKKESICAKFILCNMLEHLYGMNDYFITTDENGKPHIENGSVFFNLSHSKDMVFCTVSDKEVGCDVQIISEFRPKVAARFFTESEYNMLMESKVPDSDFIRLWTVKESILKHSGKGIAGGLSSYDFYDCCKDGSFSKYGLNFKTFMKDKYAFTFCSEEVKSCLYQLKTGGD